MSFFSQGLLSGSGHFSPRHRNREQGGHSLPSMKSNIPRGRAKSTWHIFTPIRSYIKIRVTHLVQNPWTGKAVEAEALKSLGAFCSCQTWRSSKMPWFRPVADRRTRGLTPLSPSRLPACPGCAGSDWLGFDPAWPRDLAERPGSGLSQDPKPSRWVQAWGEGQYLSVKWSVRCASNSGDVIYWRPKNRPGKQQSRHQIQQSTMLLVFGISDSEWGAFLFGVKKKLKDISLGSEKNVIVFHYFLTIKKTTNRLIVKIIKNIQWIVSCSCTLDRLGHLLHYVRLSKNNQLRAPASTSNLLRSQEKTCIFLKISNYPFNCEPTGHLWYTFSVINALFWCYLYTKQIPASFSTTCCNTFTPL